MELESEDAVRRLDPEAVDLAALCCRGVSATARGGGADYVLRFFAPSVGVAEDPVTGSAQCLLGPYWAAALGRTRLCATQLSARGGVLRVRVGATRVGVGGRASTVFVAASSQGARHSSSWPPPGTPAGGSGWREPSPAGRRWLSLARRPGLW